MHTPTKTRLGERKHLLSSEITLETFIKDVLNVVDAEDWDVSTLRAQLRRPTVADVADRVSERIARLVFLDANAVEPGRSAMDGLSPAVRDERLRLAQERSDGLAFAAPPAESFGVTTADDAA